MAPAQSTRGLRATDHVECAHTDLTEGHSLTLPNARKTAGLCAPPFPAQQGIKLRETTQRARPNGRDQPGVAACRKACTHSAHRSSNGPSPLRSVAVVLVTVVALKQLLPTRERGGAVISGDGRSPTWVETRAVLGKGPFRSPKYAGLGFAEITPCPQSWQGSSLP